MQSAQQVLQQYLKERGIRYSNQRMKVLEIFLDTERHLTASELFELVREKYPKIGYATVYRAMKIITEAGLAEEVDFGDGVRRFEHKYGHKHHDHLICIKCGKFLEVTDKKIEKEQENLANRYGFTLLWHKMNLYGVCKKCKEKSNGE